MFKNKSIEEYTAVLASDSPTPGGGSALAVVCAVAVSLVEMACNVTIKKYAKKAIPCDELRRLLPKLTELHLQALDTADKDAEAFEQILSAMRLPKETEEQKETRKKALQAAYKKGLSTCLVLMKTAYDCIPLAETANGFADRFVASDSEIGIQLCKAVVKNAEHTALANLDCITDEDYVEEKKTEIQLYLSAC